MSDARFVILGGGMVAGYAARELVSRGLRSGDCSIVSADDALPYERPPLSKGFLAGKEDEASILINDAAFYPRHGIEVRLNSVVEHVDLQRKRLYTRSGDAIGFEKLLIATGAYVRTLNNPGADLDGVLYLRSLDDSKRIRAIAASAARAVVLGSGFIGMEVASVLSQKGIGTTMVYPDQRVWQRFFTPEMSAFFQHYYAERGVILLPGQRATSFDGEGHVSAVTLDSGRRLETEMVIAGIGVVPATEPVRDSGLRIEHGIVTNEYLETSAANVYAAGDAIAYWDTLFEKRRHVEHWDNAVEQGKHAAGLLMGERRPFVHVPYFFSDVFDLSFEVWGDAEGADQVIHQGDLGRGAFSVWWLREGRTIAAFVMNRPEEERELAPHLIAEHRPPPESFRNQARPVQA